MSVFAEICMKESWTFVRKTEREDHLDQAGEFEGNVMSDTELQVLVQRSDSDMVHMGNWRQVSRVAGVGRDGVRNK